MAEWSARQAGHPAVSGSSPALTTIASSPVNRPGDFLALQTAQCLYW